MVDHKLRAMTDADLEQVLKWRNHPEVRRYMYTNHEISMDEHCKWYAGACKNTSIDLLIYEQGPKAQGFVSITRTRDLKVADWGFYLAPTAPKGSGRELGKQALTYAFTQLGLHKVCGQAIAFNGRSIAFHKALGFAEEGRLREQHFAGGEYHDVVCFGLLIHEWQTKAKE